MAVRGQLLTLLAASGVFVYQFESRANTYQEPPAAIQQLLESARIPTAASSPDGRWILLTQHAAGDSAAQLGATRHLVVNDNYTIDPKTRTWREDHRARGVGMTLVRMKDGAQWPLAVPTSRITDPVWSPDSTQFIFRHTAEAGVELWIADVATRNVRRLVGPELNALQSRGLPCIWMQDGSTVLCRMAVAVSGAPIDHAEQRSGPLVSESKGAASFGVSGGALATAGAQHAYRSYWTVQPTLVDTRTGARREVGQPGIYETLLPSPNGRHLFTAKVVEPYSVVYPPDFFPRLFEVLDLQSGAVTAIGRRDLAPMSHAPDAVPIGYRRFAWAPAQPATLVFIDAQSSPVEPQGKAWDRIMRWPAPFSGVPDEIFRSRERLANISESVTFTSLREYANLAWLEDGRAWIEGIDYENSRKRIWLLDVADESAGARLIADFGIDRGDPDPGAPLLTVGAPGEADSARAVIRQTDNTIHMTGIGPFGRAFVDRFDVARRESRRIYEAAAGRDERVLNLFGRDEVLSLVETSLLSPHLELIDLRNLVSRDVLVPVPLSPQLSGVTIRQLRYAREDGIELAGTLLLPPGYRPGNRVPVLVWAYPSALSESAARNGQAAVPRESPHRFLWRLDDPLKLAASSLLLSGYAVLWRPSIVVVGDRTGGETAVAQMVASAEAAVKALVEIGVADADRIAIAGHSYGGAMTALLLANSSLFSAGIAIDGIYNFTLRPTGFHAERRPLWEAPQVYMQLSALFAADRITAPLLLIHGQRDPSVPARESQLLHAALDALGRKSRLVLLPHEGHAPQTKEAIGHVAWEMQSWLDAHVSNAP